MLSADVLSEYVCLLMVLYEHCLLITATSLVKFGDYCVALAIVASASLVTIQTSYDKQLTI